MAKVLKATDAVVIGVGWAGAILARELGLHAPCDARWPIGRPRRSLQNISRIRAHWCRPNTELSSPRKRGPSIPGAVVCGTMGPHRMSALADMRT